MNQSSQQTLPPPEAFEAARRFQAAGDLDQAKRHYGQVLINVPHHAEALVMLASISYQQGDDVQAEAYLERAIGIYRHVVTHMPENLGVRAPLVNSLLARGRRDEAEHYIRVLKLPLNPIRATPQVFTQRRKDGIARGLPAMLINTLPKSASESIWNRLAEGLGLAQSHLSLGLFPECCLVPARLQSAASGGLIAKEHLPATPFNLQQLAQHGLTKVVFHQRDPRQATLSWAHFVQSDVSMRLLAPIWRKTVPPADILKGPFPALLDWCIDRYLPIAVDFIRGWTRLGDDPTQPIEVLFLTFEQFLSEPERYFERVLDFYGIPREVFAAEAEAEVVHLRRGLVDEWREAFTPAQQERAWRQIPPELAEAYGWCR
ncbi:MAG: tetratricopeptide repeat protein [Kiloniellales bacterium]